MKLCNKKTPSIRSADRVKNTPKYVRASINSAWNRFGLFYENISPINCRQIKMNERKSERERKRKEKSFGTYRCGHTHSANIWIYIIYEWHLASQDC